MYFDNVPADKQTDPHVVLSAAWPQGDLFQISVQARLLGETQSVIRHKEVSIMSMSVNLNGKVAGMAMNNCVFHKVVEDLFNQKAIHGHFKPLLWDVCLNGDIRKAGLKFVNAGSHNFLNRLKRSLKLKRVVSHPGDREKIFHHPHHPLRLVPDVLQKFFTLLIRKILLFQQS